MTKRKGSKVFRLERNHTTSGMKERLFGGRAQRGHGSLAASLQYHVPDSGSPSEASLARSLRAIAAALSARDRG